MITEVLDDDVLNLDGPVPIPPRRARKPSDQQKRKVDGLFHDKVSAPPSDSWWLGLTDYESFYRQQMLEQERMQTSKFGRMKGNIPESPA